MRRLAAMRHWVALTASATSTVATAATANQHRHTGNVRATTTTTAAAAAAVDDACARESALARNEPTMCRRGEPLVRARVNE